MPIKIESRVGIQAASDDIWELLGDFARWSHWNPVHPEVQGALRIGAPLMLRERLSEGEGQMLSASVVEWVPREQIIWAMNRGLMARSVRYFEIEELDRGSCIFANGEIWSGFLGEFDAKRERARRRAAFERISMALKAAVEG
ncbi:SRPBCC domain-containing protein [Brevundimonas sp. 2R-24]|uniref:SRPBCC domain-containing protein n=1 Tax=Peiella sedimenti TaxID=3061083 RepID=A0ABT8SM11_9CAUL|nr:SRPBCC domain-containing protein [Caulobacteraceae bacterium XZ-24]